MVDFCISNFEILSFVVIVCVIIIYYHRFPFPWFFCSWNKVAPYHSDFKFQTIALSVLCVISLVQLLFL